MNSLRLRLAIAFCLFGIVPMLILLIVVSYFNLGDIPAIAAMILAVGCLMVGRLVAVGLVRPFTELMNDFEEVVAGRQIGLGEASLFPELGRIRRALGILLTDQRNAKLRLEELVAQRTRKLEESQSLLQRSNGFLSATFDSSPDGILVVDLEGRLITANRQFVERFHLPNEIIEGGNGRLADAICRQFQDSELIRRRWDFYSSEADRSAEEEWEVLTPEQCTYYVFTAPVTLDDNSPFARLWIFRDKTQQKNLEYGLQQAQKMEAVGRLAGGIAHDFNNLLTAISGNISLALLEAGEQNQGVKDRLSTVQQATERAIELVRQLLGYSRKSHLVFERSNLNEVVHEVESILRHSFDPRVRFQMDLASDLWDVEADATQIQQVLINMCVNARDAMPEKGGEITLSTRNITLTDEDIESTGSLVEAGDFAVISVRDNGEGIPSQLRDRIFEPFFTTKDPGSGTGLGLAMSFGIIRQHDGWIDFASEIGEGTEFVIYLPKSTSPAEEASGEGAPPEPAGEAAVLSEEETGEEPEGEAGDVFVEAAEPEEVGEEEEASPQTPVAGGGRGGGSGQTVLIVDDEDSVRAIGEGVLGHHGYSVITASDGVQALERVAEYGDDISAIMLDLTMPNLSGKDTFKCLNEVGSTIPVLICSGFLVDLDEFALETGGRPAGFLQKPYKIEGLVTAIRDVIETDAVGALPTGPEGGEAAVAVGSGIETG